VETLTARLLAELKHAPTPGQRRAIEALDRLLATPKDRATLILKGYAGTGKTTLVGALVRVLATTARRTVLLAPTGRAAKVLSAYARAEAGTIHRRIYTMSDDDFGDARVKPNRDAGALFVVDEASMIGGGEGGFGDRDLLKDLFQHVFSAPGCKLLLIGDPAQLPPVGSPHSPALDVKHLAAMGLVAGQVELTEVVRQEGTSGILVNATALRGLLDDDTGQQEYDNGHPASAAGQRFLPRFTAFPDVERIDGTTLQDALEEAYARHGDDEVCLVCRSNKRAYQYSQQVRARIHGFDEELMANDRLMVVKNNYWWAGANGRKELIANGEQMSVLRMKGIEERYGLRFADLDVSWWNGTEERELEVKAIVDVLASEGPALPGPRMRQLARSVYDSIEARTKGERFKRFREDPYANALQVKYAYAVTAHKAQGGQWRSVFVDQGYVTEDMLDAEYVRWLYTAVTRASEKLYLLNFHPRFWGEEEA